MRYRTLGRNNGLRVSEFALGAGNFGTRWGTGAEPKQARELYDAFVAAGGNFIDTADTYQFGESEELIGQFVAADRDDIVLATKFSVGAQPGGGISRTGNGRKNLRMAVEASLRRLNTDYIDLLWVHYPDALTPVEELLRAMDDLVREGKILYTGFSNFPAWRVSRAATLAEVRGWSPVSAIQVEYSLVERSADRELLPMAEALGLGALLWSPLGGGLLTGKYRASDEGRLTSLKTLVHTESTDQKATVIDAVLATAEQFGRPPAQIAIAWLRERARRSATSVIPIIGPRTTKQLADYLGALTVELPDDTYRHLEQISAPSLGIPHEANAVAVNGLQGGHAESFEPRRTPVA
ncbi:aldo/keto reductase [Gordonia sp. TBRC 11910]|uniref:Aldo/keto reductase n=1 Tax=Gordonia asplenii TaxID=2725283 RepID=A0A848KWR7_9ACTN|nr:aldo/keto reductase [Gordonia asplenii]NMO02749.1 aldo/keto reductase [Gordonia asplenii]